MSYGRPANRAWDQLSSDGDNSAGDDVSDDFLPTRPRPLQYLGTPAGYAANSRGAPLSDHAEYNNISASTGRLSFDRSEPLYDAEVNSVNSNFHNSMPSLGVGVGVEDAAVDESSMYLTMGAQQNGTDNYQPGHRRETVAPQLPPPRAGRAMKPPSKTEEPSAPFPRRSNRFKFPATRKADVVVGRAMDARRADPNSTTINCDHCNAAMQIPPSGATALVAFCSKCKNVTPNSTATTGAQEFPKHVAMTSFASYAP